MFAAIVITAVLFGLFIASVVLWVVFLRFGLRWAKVQGVTTPRLIVATVICFAVQLLLKILFLFLSPRTEAQAILFGLTELASFALVAVLIIMTVFRTRFLRAVQVWFDVRRAVEFPLKKFPENPSKDQFFVMGDNSPQSKDARLWSDDSGYNGVEFGAYVERDLLIGEAVFIYWPHGWRTPVWRPNFERMGLIY